MVPDKDVRLADGDHIVHFYGDDADLASQVAGCLAGALRDGHAVVVIATDQHRALFRSELAGLGIEVDAAIEAGQLVALDALEVLARFMIGGRPDADAFHDVVGDIVRSATAEGRAVRAFGEMVAVLWAEGNVTGAIELEGLWNELGAALSFALLCAYPSELMAEATACEAFGEVCHLHSTVIAGPPVPERAEVSRHFNRSATAPRLARRFVAATLTDWGLEPLIDHCSLVVGELTSNAVVHADSEFTVSLSRRDGHVETIVGDRSSVAPRVREPDTTGGRGLRLVSILAHEWGFHRAATGKLVWARLDVDRPSTIPG